MRLQLASMPPAGEVRGVNRSTARTGAPQKNQRDQQRDPQHRRQPAQPGGRFAAAGASAQEDERCDGKRADDQEPGEKRAQAVAAAAIGMVERCESRPGQCGDADRKDGIDGAQRHRDPGNRVKPPIAAPARHTAKERAGIQTGASRRNEPHIVESAVACGRAKQCADKKRKIVLDSVTLVG